MDTKQSFLPVVGIDLGGTQLRVAIMRGSCILAEIRELTGQSSSPEHIIPRLHDTIERVLDKAGIDKTAIEGVGVGFAGPLDSRTGVVFTSPNLKGWDNFPFLEVFRKPYTPYKWPIYLVNDANASGIGEYTFGAGCGSKNFVYLTISTGIGGCVILNGHILTGASGAAAELGHMTIDWNGEICSCGNRGCLENLASGTAIAKQAQYLIDRGASIPRLKSRVDNNFPLDAREIVSAAQAGNPEAKKILKRAGEALGVGLINILHIFNPEIVVLGGGVIEAGQLLLEPAKAVMQQRAMNVAMKDVRITMANLGPDVGLIGAGAMVYLNDVV
jgi:glucokinase